jgi:hypothetical protein
MLNASSMLETCTDEVYAISEDNGSDKEVDKPTKNVPQNLTPVTIMVVDTISSIRSIRLLKFYWILDPLQLLSVRNVYPKSVDHAKYLRLPCQISQSRIVNKLTGLYQLPAMVVTRNFRLPKLDKKGMLNIKKPSYLSQIPANMM